MNIFVIFNYLHLSDHHENHKLSIFYYIYSDLSSSSVEREIKDGETPKSLKIKKEEKAIDLGMSTSFSQRHRKHRGKCSTHHDRLI